MKRSLVRVLWVLAALPAVARAEHDALGNYVGPSMSQGGRYVDDRPVGSNPDVWSRYYQSKGISPLQSPFQDNSLMGTYRRTPRPGDQIPAADGGNFTFLSVERPSFLLSNPTIVPAFLVSGTVAAPIAVFGTVVGAVSYGTSWIVYLNGGGYWVYSPPPRPHPTFSAR